MNENSDNFMRFIVPSWVKAKAELFFLGREVKKEYNQIIAIIQSFKNWFPESYINNTLDKVQEGNSLKLACVGNGLTMVGASFFMKDIVEGFILVIAVGIIAFDKELLHNTIFLCLQDQVPDNIKFMDYIT